MENTAFEWSLAGHKVLVSFLYPFTRFMLRPLPARAPGQIAELFATSDLIERGRRFLEADSSDAYVEYRCFIGLSSRWLLRFHACVFHAVAFSWRGRAWLVAAPSGIGKTTQYLNWQRLFPGEIQMISGDMPILEAVDGEHILIHPSSWNGKENLYGASAAPLGGLVYLVQGNEDKMLPFPPKEAVIPLLRQFMVLPETEQEALQLASLLEKVFQTVPCRQFINRGGDESTVLLRDTLSGFLDRGDENV